MFGDTIQNFSVLPVRRVERVAQRANGVDALDAIARVKAAVALIPNVSKTMPPEVNLLKVCQDAGWPVPSSLHQIKQV